MKRKGIEATLVLCTIAVLAWFLQNTEESTVSFPTQKPQSLSTPTGQSDTRKRPKMYLNPNMSRPAEQLNPKDISVDGIRVGMNFQEVAAILGNPQRVLGHYSPGFTMEFAPQLKGFVDQTIVEFKAGQVVSVTGLQVGWRGQEVCRILDNLDALTSQFGQNDYTHGEGPGGSPVYCWAAPNIVFAASSGVEESQVTSFRLGDPTTLKERPHLWWTGCGGVEDTLYMPPGK